ncbi:hypothetical protein DL96DRAFT_1712002 [Flagelloscypha sp. PMI_526]|nr:hypothetical protein DL96DRAFT_1712002 [Flagelloscypha sp. PMI_526]
MVQGKTKGLQASSKSSARQNARSASNTKKGKRTIAPKKAPLIKQAAVRRNLTAKINKSIENQMVNAASGGKLTIMKHAMPSEGSSKS